jgi:arsenite methyltransferase
MLNFDERDLFRLAAAAGFGEIHMDYHAHLERWPETTWSALVAQAPNPNLPTWEESMNEVLTSAEKEAFIAHVRPQVEQRTGRSLSAAVYLWAAKE